MAKLIENLNLNKIHPKDDEEEKLYYVDKHLLIAMNAKDFGLKRLQANQPYRVDEGRVIMVAAGWLRITINLEEYFLEQQSLIVLVPDSFFEILEWSNDFDMRAFSFKELPIFTSLSQQTVLRLNDDEWLLTNEYLRLMWHEAQRKPLIPEVFVHLQTALMMEIRRFAEREESTHSDAATRQETLFHQFLNQVKLYGLRERRVEFYANKLCVSPSHLGASVRQASGLTIMQWLNRHAIQKAKLLLRYTDFPIWEVSEQMNFANPSFFSKFFKRETGLTPGEYKSQR